MMEQSEVLTLGMKMQGMVLKSLPLRFAVGNVCLLVMKLPLSCRNQDGLGRVGMGRDTAALPKCHRIELSLRE